jgi:hypothetical protein
MKAVNLVQTEEEESSEEESEEESGEESEEESEDESEEEDPNLRKSSRQRASVKRYEPPQSKVGETKERAALERRAMNARIGPPKKRQVG